MALARLFTFSRFRLVSSIVVAVAVVATGTAGPEMGDATAAAQAAAACTLLPVVEIQPLAAKETVAEGVSSSNQAIGSTACHYSWGTGTRRFRLDVIVNDASKMYPGLNADVIKQQLQAAVKPGTIDAPVAEIGEAAVFRSESPVLATTAAYVKGRILRLQLDGLYASEKKDQMIALLKSAASRL
jgi:hypothetical protein